MSDTIENKNKFTNLDLKEMQNWDLDRKIATSLARISEFNAHFPHKTYISFSGGKDSTVLLHLVRRLYPDTPAVFIDTGLEYPEVREFALSQKNVVKLTPEMNFKKVIQTYGYPVISKEQSAFIQEYRDTHSEKLRNIRWNGNNYGRGKISKKWRFMVDAPFKISDKCCDIMKKNPAKKYEKQNDMHPIIGVMAEESAQRKSNWLMYGCNMFGSERSISKPLSFWTEQDILEYLVRYDLPCAKVYGEIVRGDDEKLSTTGAKRTGCMFCMFGCHLEKEPNRFQRLKITHPKVWEFCMKPWDKGGLGMREVLEYIGVKTE